MRITKNIKVVHIEDTAQDTDKAAVTEIDGVQTIEDEISFPAESFSTYALLLEDGLGKCCNIFFLI